MLPIICINGKDVSKPIYVGLAAIVTLALGVSQCHPSEKNTDSRGVYQINKHERALDKDLEKPVNNYKN